MRKLVVGRVSTVELVCSCLRPVARTEFLPKHVEQVKREHARTESVTNSWSRGNRLRLGAYKQIRS